MYMIAESLYMLCTDNYTNALFRTAEAKNIMRELNVGNRNMSVTCVMSFLQAHCY